MAEQPAKQPTFAGWMGSVWLYTVLRYGLFLALWGVLYLAGLRLLFAGLIAAALSLPLSYVFLHRPRARLAAQVEQRVNAHREARAELDDKLDGKDEEPTQESA